MTDSDLCINAMPPTSEEPDIAAVLNGRRFSCDDRNHEAVP
jgi:hypothetical protein